MTSKLAIAAVLVAASSCPSPSVSDGGAQPVDAGTVVPKVLLKVAGDEQLARPGEAVAIEPVVEVRDDTQPLAGVVVAFTVIGGDGNVERSTVVSDANGRASAGRWTLGSAEMNLLRARAGDVEVIFSAIATTRVSSPDVQLVLEQPTLDLAARDNLTVQARVSSTRALAAVTATLGSSTAAMTPVVGASGVFSATLDLASEPERFVLLTVEARDVQGAATNVLKVMRRDRPPKITVVKPTAWSIANPTLEYEFTCRDDFDDAGCAALIVRGAGTTFATGSGASLAGTTDLSAEAGTELGLVLSGRDLAGSTTDVTVPLIVESAPALQPKHVLPGRVLDVRGSRVLFEDATTGALSIRDVTSGRSWIVSTSPPRSTAALTPTGALFIEAEHVREWTETATTDLGPALRFEVANTFALWEHQNDWTTRDLTAKTSTSLGRVSCPGLGPNGDVVFVDQGVRRWRAGTIELLSPASDAFCPRTDGSNTAYQTGASFNFANTLVLRRSDGTERVLEPPVLGPNQPFFLANGWAVFGKVDAFGTNQVWRAGTGADVQLSASGRSSTAEAIGDDGTVLFLNQGQRSVAKVGDQPKLINRGLGTALWRDGQFLLLIGNTIFELSP